ncbi:hypothetical protein CBR_g64885 [Chara braunii]|uniref:Reverse transcriptase domain-containing protein n=1 Tax=Chara braunii TaxID=69332 RepID=A0A388K957_CHABU|nr:hypothetical protein CBR_g64885 [Chara braunii]|eukprot:GBG66614.1 hypothetical protein CBR_g64885 [Chara braunii]
MHLVYVSAAGEPVKMPPEIEGVVAKYRDLFEEPTGVVEREVVHATKIIPGSSILKGRIYRMSPGELDELCRQLKELVEKGWIRPSVSPYGSPVLFVPKKKEGTLRMCLDNRGLNAITVKNREPLPRIDDLLDRVQGCRYFSKIDLKSGYHQIAIRPEDQHKTAFQTRYGLYEFVVMPFSLCNAPGTFQHTMNQIFHDYLDKFVIVYLDDILIFSKTVEEHVAHLDKVLSLLRQHKFKINGEKCEFGRTCVLYLGHEIFAEGLKPDDAKVASIRDWPHPQSVTEMRSFLGMTGYYRNFVKNYSIVAAPLTDLTRLDTPWEWTDRCEAAFRHLKHALTHREVLKLPDPDKPFILRDRDCQPYDARKKQQQQQPWRWQHDEATGHRQLSPTAGYVIKGNNAVGRRADKVDGQGEELDDGGDGHCFRILQGSWTPHDRYKKHSSSREDGAVDTKSREGNNDLEMGSSGIPPHGTQKSSLENTNHSPPDSAMSDEQESSHSKHQVHHPFSNQGSQPGHLCQSEQDGQSAKRSNQRNSFAWSGGEHSKKQKKQQHNCRNHDDNPKDEDEDSYSSEQQQKEQELSGSGCRETDSLAIHIRSLSKPSPASQNSHPDDTRLCNSSDFPWRNASRWESGRGGEMRRSNGSGGHCGIGHEPAQESSGAKEHGIGERSTGPTVKMEESKQKHPDKSQHNTKCLSSAGETLAVEGTEARRIIPLFEKMLSATDAGRIGRLVLPKAYAESPATTCSKSSPGIGKSNAAYDEAAMYDGRHPAGHAQHVCSNMQQPSNSGGQDDGRGGGGKRKGPGRPPGSRKKKLRSSVEGRQAPGSGPDELSDGAGSDDSHEWTRTATFAQERTDKKFEANAVEKSEVRHAS